jgi:hypothetical protein
MRAVVAALLLAGTLLVAGCLGGPAAVQQAPEPTDLPKYVAELPKVYVSTGELLDPDYENPEFPRMVQVLLGARGAEPNIGVTSKGSIFITAFDHTVRSQDGGKTWQRVYDFALAPGAPVDPFSTADPMLWVDPDTDRVFTNHMWPPLVCASNVISDDEGATWLHAPMACGTPVVDHQKIMTAKPRAPLTGTPAYPNLVYLCYNKLLTTQCAVSLDGGLRYHYETSAISIGQCGGINGHPAAGHDGTVYVPAGLNCGIPTVAVTKDNGLTWTVRQFGQAMGMEEIDPEITVTPDGTAYYFGRGRDGSGYLYRTKNDFATVDGPYRVNPPDVQGVVFAGLASGDDGRIAIAYLGNREWAGDPSRAPDNTTWHLFTTFSYDAAAPQPTFTTHQVSPNNDPVQIGCIWMRGGGNPCRNLLDFIDAVIDKEGRFHVAFTDGCTARTSCAGNPDATPAESRERAVALAIQNHGPSLYVAKGLLPDLGWAKQVNDPTGAYSPPS